MRRFIWSGRDHGHSFNLVNRAIITSPKNCGRFGLKEARLMNISLLGILIWHLLCDKHKFWVSILSHKYIKNRDILNVNHSRGASYV